MSASNPWSGGVSRIAKCGVRRQKRYHVFVSNYTKCTAIPENMVNETSNVTAAQIRSARAWLDWSQDVLAAQSGVTRATIANFEMGRSAPQPRTLRDLRRTLEDAGIEFVFDGDEGIGIQARRA